MITTNVNEIQKEFADSLAKSSARLAKAWGQALSAAGAEDAHEAPDRKVGERGQPSAFLKIITPVVVAENLREIMKLAAGDLPELAQRGGEKETVRKIKRKLVRSQEKLIRDMFGLPAPTEMERLMDEWRSLFRTASVPAGYFGAFPAFPGFAPPEGFSFPGGTGAMPDLFRAWNEMYKNTMGKYFQEVRKTTMPEEARAGKALEAQLDFLRTLPELREMLLQTSRKALENVVDAIAKWNLPEVTSETYELFNKLWLATNENAYVELFKSDNFTRALGKSIQRGSEARNTVSSVISDTLAFWGVPGKKDFDEIRQAVDAMSEKIHRLEEELDAVKQCLDRILCQKAEHEGAEPVA